MKPLDPIDIANLNHFDHPAPLSINSDDNTNSDIVERKYKGVGEFFRKYFLEGKL